MTDDEKNKALIESGRLLFARSTEFMLSVVGLEHLPNADLPEVCFAGRSNVGKSSLINALSNQKNLARASNTPGRTRELNYFDLGGRIRMVDLPGYGYARASKVHIESWTKLTRRYLKGRACLRRVFLLIDSRRGIKDPDLEIMDMLDDAATSYQIILTKIDKLKKGERARVETDTLTKICKRPAAFPTLVPTSSVKKNGLSQLKAEIVGLALPDNRV
ncbi:MAG: ribosome biogenesis GTP-binding protein YihA/YsxC [Robiginitomaculum sp.]